MLCLIIIISAQTTAIASSLTYKEELVTYASKEAVKRKSVMDIIRSILNKKPKARQEMLEPYIMPKQEYYLDPPVIPHNKKYKLASSLTR